MNETEQSKADAMAKDGILVEWLSGLCPVQGNGWIDEKYAFYFRARHDEWSMDITKGEATDSEEALAWADTIWKYREQYGVDPEAGYMPNIEALQFIEQAVNLFRSAK